MTDAEMTGTEAMTTEEKIHRTEVLGLLIDENNATRKTLNDLFRNGTITPDAYEILLAGLDALVTPYFRELRTLLAGTASTAARNPEGFDR